MAVRDPTAIGRLHLGPATVVPREVCTAWTLTSGSPGRGYSVRPTTRQHPQPHGTASGRSSRLFRPGGCNVPDSPDRAGERGNRVPKTAHRSIRAGVRSPTSEPASLDVDTNRCYGESAQSGRSSSNPHKWFPIGELRRSEFKSVGYVVGGVVACVWGHRPHGTSGRGRPHAANARHPPRTSLSQADPRPCSGRHHTVGKFNAGYQDPSE